MEEGLREFRRVCVFCGSSTGASPAYREAATALGRLLAERGVGVVFGGGRIGLMGALAEAALACGGEVVGVIPGPLRTRELAHPGVAAMHVVPTMHARKALMNELSDAFLALPGGFGTFDELFEVVTWGQLGIHEKPIGLLNVGGYFDALLAMVDHAVAEGFVRQPQRELLCVATDPGELLAAMARHRPAPILRWVTPAEA